MDIVTVATEAVLNQSSKNISSLRRRQSREQAALDVLNLVVRTVLLSAWAGLLMIAQPKHGERFQAFDPLDVLSHADGGPELLL